MALEQLMQITDEREERSDLFAFDGDIENVRQNITEKRLLEALPSLRLCISFFREYPDLLVDFYRENASEREKKGALHLFAYQRVFLRAVMRHRRAYMTFPRA